MDPSTALRVWDHPGELRTADEGLINRTWLVTGAGGQGLDAVLQWVNPIFSARIHDDIEAVTAWIAAAGLSTPRLRRTAAGALCVPDPQGGTWRLLSYLPGRTLHAVSGPAMAHSAGALVGCFHAALADFPGPFQAPPRKVHDTPARMADLQAAMEQADGHALDLPGRDLGRQVLQAWASWEGELDLPERPAHGDLKISNLRFAAEEERATALLDLDTLGPLPLAVELGDAWRSWCNPAGESDPDGARFDLAVFEASARGWLSTGPRLSAEERASLVPGIERICLELAARFGADALKNTYFSEDRARWPQAGAHNLLRAQGQLALARAARAARRPCQEIIDAA